jgi:transcriptional regulator with XRE-family HTH domain
MNLNDWLKQHDRSQTDFAKEIGISDAYFSRILSGDRGASLTLAAKIRTATDGKVDLNDLIKLRKAS